MVAFDKAPHNRFCFWAGRGHSVSYHFAEPAQEKLPKGAKPGDLFTGEGVFFRFRCRVCIRLIVGFGFGVGFNCFGFTFHLNFDDGSISVRF